LNPFFEGLSAIGTWGAIWLGAGLLAAYLLRRPMAFVAVAVADGAAQGVNSAIKDAVDRPRPHVHPLVGEPHSSSFPSGHAASSFACALMLSWIAPPAAAPAFVLAALIAASRVYVGVHYPLDVIGGAAVGLAVATALRLLARALRRSPPGPRAG
jgi:undecaprenyl-diphosphatase